jgi:hypothetical protein
MSATHAVINNELPESELRQRRCGETKTKVRGHSYSYALVNCVQAYTTQDYDKFLRLG